MRPETEEVARALRYGYTTGACATAASVAAASAALNSAISPLLQSPHHHSPLCKRGAGGDFLLVAEHAEGKIRGDFLLGTATIHLPRGQHATFPLETLTSTADGAEAAVIKDAGDDPDVTHGARIWAQVQLSTETGVQFRAGSGVGTVTLPGLPIPAGEPAINPTPRRMITEHLNALAMTVGYTGGFVVTVGIDNGAVLAQKTLNPRLGIIGGLSILGTTGIVRPFSCSAYIFSIRRAIDVAYANGCAHIGACTGAASEQLLRTQCGLPDVALIEMGDFAGAVLKYLRKVPISRLSIAGGFGKISKLAAGHLNLHSAHSTVDMPWLAKIAGHLGADAALQQEITAANTSQQALVLAHHAGLPLGDHICQLARDAACAIVARDMTIDLWAIDRAGIVVGKTKCQFSLA